MLVDKQMRIGTIEEMRRDHNPWIRAISAARAAVRPKCATGRSRKQELKDGDTRLLYRRGLVRARVLAGLVIAFLWFAARQLSEHMLRYETYFASVGSGLSAGSPVRVNGMQVGRVAEMRSIPTRRPGCA